MSGAAQGATGVVSYRNSTSNHNPPLHLSSDTDVVSYRNSTSNHNSAVHCSVLSSLYLIEILHQTTTFGVCSPASRRCILSKFYIKPQLRRKCPNFCCRCILSKFYIKPQPWSIKVTPTIVVSYRNSTSNHNSSEPAVPAWMLYLIEILHQTTTRHLGCRGRRGLYLIEILHQTTTRPSTFRLTQTLYLIEILHQTTTSSLREAALQGCILSKFYIKPQLLLSAKPLCKVVSYRNSTSNHNSAVHCSVLSSLYLIEILHQTTTCATR